MSVCVGWGERVVDTHLLLLGPKELWLWADVSPQNLCGAALSGGRVCQISPAKDKGSGIRYYGVGGSRCLVLNPNNQDPPQLKDKRGGAGGGGSE